MADGSSRLETVLRKALDANVGLFTSLVQVPIQAGDPRIHICIIKVQNPLRVSPRSKARFIDEFALYGTGVGVDREAALWSAVGEACERYAGSIYDPDDLIVSTFDNLEGDALDPRGVILHTDDQYERSGFPIRKYDPNEPISWALGINLHTGRPAWVPASLAFMYFIAKTAGDNFCKYATTGLAAGPDYASALCSGICEIIERDGFMCHWLLKRTPPSVLLEHLSDETFPLLRSFRRPGEVDLVVRDITTDLGVPCFYVGAHSPNAPGVFSGASCNTSPVAALTKAFYECAHTYSWGHQLLRQFPNGIKAEEIVQFDDHLKHYLNEAVFHKTAFMFDTAASPSAWAGHFTPAPPQPPQDRLRFLLQRLQERGYTAYALNVTTDDMRELGIAVTRVVIPGLHPLHAGFGLEHRDPRRLLRMARHWRLPEPIQFYDYPHPFP